MNTNIRLGLVLGGQGGRTRRLAPGGLFYREHRLGRNHDRVDVFTRRDSSTVIGPHSGVLVSNGGRAEHHIGSAGEVQANHGLAATLAVRVSAARVPTEGEIPGFVGPDARVEREWCIVDVKWSGESVFGSLMSGA